MLDEPSDLETVTKISDDNREWVSNHSQDVTDPTSQFDESGNLLNFVANDEVQNGSGADEDEDILSGNDEFVREQYTKTANTYGDKDFDDLLSNESDIDKELPLSEQTVAEEKSLSEQTGLKVEGRPELSSTSSVIPSIMTSAKSSDIEMPAIPADTNSFTDTQGRSITSKRFGDDDLIQLRAYDTAKGPVPETPTFGTAGRVNLHIETGTDGSKQVKLQDIEIPPGYRKSGIAGSMLDQAVEIAKAKGASEIYGVIENNEALSYWKHMGEKGTGWRVYSRKGAYGYIRYELSDGIGSNNGMGIRNNEQNSATDVDDRTNTRYAEQTDNAGSNNETDTRDTKQNSDAGSGDGNTPGVGDAPKDGKGTRLERVIPEQYGLDNGQTLEIYRTVYTDKDGQHWVEQQKIDGKEIGHITRHADGTVNVHGHSFMQEGRRIVSENTSRFSDKNGKANDEPEKSLHKILDTFKKNIEDDESIPLEQRELDASKIESLIYKTIEKANDIKDLDSKNAKKNLYERSCTGELAEQLSYASTGAQNLNDLSYNFPWTDGVTPTEIKKVKTHINVSEKSALSSYANDLSVALGMGEKSKIDSAVDKLWDLRSDEKWNKIAPKFPPEVQNAKDKASMKSTMLDKVTLRVPADDVSKLQDYVRVHARKNPEKYGLKNASDAEIEKLVSRIKPIATNISNHQMKRMTRYIFQRKMEKAGYRWGIDYAKHLKSKSQVQLWGNVGQLSVR